MPAEKTCSHFAHPGAADSQVLRSSDIEAFAAMAHLLFAGSDFAVSLPGNDRVQKQEIEDGRKRTDPRGLGIRFEGARI